MKKRCVVLFFVVLTSILFTCSCHQHEYVLAYSEDVHYQICKDCSKVINEEPHKSEWGVVEESTCNKVGFQKFCCSTCKYTYETKEIPLKDHYFESYTIEGSCTMDTMYGKKCTLCGLNKLESLEACSGHNLSDWIRESENTCSQVGLEKRVCLNENCEFEETRDIKKVNHDFLVEQSPTREDLLLYECKNCGVSYTRYSQDENCQYYDSVELFNQSTNFQFNVICFENEEYIMEHLMIVLNYLDGGPKESEGIIEYNIFSKENGLWQIAGNYESGETYVAKIDGDLSFEDYVTNKLIFTTAFNDKNIVKFKEDIKFINELKSLESFENSDCFYIEVSSAEGLQIGDILCIGEIKSFDELQAIKLIDADLPSINFGKIQAIYSTENGWKIILSYPDLEEIFDDLDVYEKENIDLEELGIDVKGIQSEIESSFVQSDDLINFLALYHETVERYAEEHGFDPVSLGRASQKGLQISPPEIRVSGTQFSVRINGNAQTPITVKEKNIGDISVEFSAYAEIQFIFSLNLSLKKKWIFVVGVNYLDMQLKQLDTFEFDFKVKMNLEYSNEDNDKLYVHNTDPNSNKLHVKNCRYLKNIKDKNKLEYLTQEEAYQKYQNGLVNECQICLPIERLNRDSFIINMQSNEIHCLNCIHAERMNFSNALFSSESAKSLHAKGYSYCYWCQPEAKESRNFEEQMLENMKYENWKDHVDEIKQWANDSSIDEYKSNGIHLGSMHFTVAYIFTINLDINLVINFKLEASLDYQYQLKHELIYGMRIQNGRAQPYNFSKELNSKNELNLMGKVEANIGVKADLYVSVLGLSKLLRAGFTAEVGIYADASGVIHQGFEDKKNYGGAYLEVGIYINIDAYYKVFSWSDSLSLFHTKLPIFQFGYDKVYYAFVDPIEFLSISSDFKLEEDKILKLEYMNIKDLRSGTESLKFDNTSNLYTVKVSLLNGANCIFENGIIKILDSAPCMFEDTLKIQIIGDTSWTNYIPNSATFCLDDYIIPIYYYNESKHSFNVKESKLADCFSDGFSTYECEICKYEKTEIEPKLSHNLQLNKGFAATCWENGKTDETVCTLCNTILIQSENLPVLGHKFNENGVCLNCGQSEESSVSVGLEYQLNGDEKSYSLIGKGDNQEYNLIVPSTYLGLPITIIKENAFASSTYVSINVGDGVRVIEENAFNKCENLRNLKLGKNVIELNSNPFSYCPSLEYIVVDDENSFYTSVNNCILSANLSTLFVGCKTSIIPEGVTNIRLKAFCGCSELTSIIIPSTVDTLQPQAFLDCFKLEEVVLPQALKYINYKCFDNCSLKYVYYYGDLSSWQTINIDGTSILLEEIVYFYSEKEPVSGRKHWHLNGQQIIIWS